MKIKRTMVAMAILFSVILAGVCFGGDNGVSAEDTEGSSATTHTVAFYSGDSLLNEYTVADGGKVTPPTVDYPVLSHWCIESIEGDTFDPESPITSDLRLYAKYVDCSLDKISVYFISAYPTRLYVSFNPDYTNAEHYYIDWGDDNIISGIDLSYQHYYSTLPENISICASNPTSSVEKTVKISNLVTFHLDDEETLEIRVGIGLAAGNPFAYGVDSWYVGSVDGNLFYYDTVIKEDTDLYPKYNAVTATVNTNQTGTISTTVKCSVDQTYAREIIIDWGDGTTPTIKNKITSRGTNSFEHEYDSGGKKHITITVKNPNSSKTFEQEIDLVSSIDGWKQDDGTYLFDESITGTIVLEENVTIDMGGHSLYASVDVGDSTLVLKNAYTFRSITGKHVIVKDVTEAYYSDIKCEVLEIYGEGNSTVDFSHRVGDGRDVTIFPGSSGNVSISESGKSDFTTTLTAGSSITIVNDLITIHGEASMGCALDGKTIQVDGKLSFSDRDDIQTGVVMMNGSKITLKDVRPGYVGMELKAGSVHMTGTFTSEDGGTIILDGQSYVDGSVVLDGVTATIMSGSTFTVSKDSTIEGINGGGIDNNGTVLVYGSLKASVDNSDGVTNFYEGSVGSNKVVGGTVNGVDTPMPVPDEDDPKKDNENKSDGIDTKTIVILLVVVGIIGIIIGRRFL